MKQRREERRDRIAAARADGQSLRAIAETEGISESQVRRDLESSGAPHGAPASTNQAVSVTETSKNDVSTDTPGILSVTGKDGITYPATRPVGSKLIEQIQEMVNLGKITPNLFRQRFDPVMESNARAT